MALLSDFFIADGGSVPDYHGDPGFPASDRCQFKSITPLEAASVLSVLRGSGDWLEMMDEFEYLTPQDADEWTMSVPNDMVSLLAALDEPRISEMAAKCSTLMSEELAWSPEDFHFVLSHLRDLAVRAGETGRAMYLWASL